MELADHKGRTALHHASSQGDCAIVEKLLQSGAQVDVGDHYASTPLYMAAKQNMVKAAQLLLSWKVRKFLIRRIALFSPGVRLVEGSDTHLYGLYVSSWHVIGDLMVLVSFSQAGPMVIHASIKASLDLYEFPQEWQEHSMQEYRS